ncbi:MAG: hypothetical protein ABWZ36_00955 [Jiangellaceae bacterium]
MSAASASVFSNAVRGAVGMEAVPRRTEPFTGLREHLDVGIAPW